MLVSLRPGDSEASQQDRTQGSLCPTGTREGTCPLSTRSASTPTWRYWASTARHQDHNRQWWWIQSAASAARSICEAPVVDSRSRTNNMIARQYVVMPITQEIKCFNYYVFAHKLESVRGLWFQPHCQCVKNFSRLKVTDSHVHWISGNSSEKRC